MKVIAILAGYDNLAVRQPGDVFELPRGADGKAPKGTWFKAVDEDTKGPKDKSAKEAPASNDLA